MSAAGDAKPSSFLFLRGDVKVEKLELLLHLQYYAMKGVAV